MAPHTFIAAQMDGSRWLAIETPVTRLLQETHPGSNRLCVLNLDTESGHALLEHSMHTPIEAACGYGSDVTRPTWKQFVESPHTLLWLTHHHEDPSMKAYVLLGAGRHIVFPPDSTVPSSGHETREKFVRDHAAVFTVPGLRKVYRKSIKTVKDGLVQHEAEASLSLKEAWGRARQFLEMGIPVLHDETLAKKEAKKVARRQKKEAERKAAETPTVVINTNPIAMDDGYDSEATVSDDFPIHTVRRRLEF